MEDGTPRPSLRVVVFDYLSTIFDTDACCRAGWSSVIEEFPNFNTHPMDSLILARMAGISHGRRIGRDITEPMGIERRRELLAEARWRKTYTHLEIPEAPTEATRLEAAFRRGHRSCIQLVEHTSDTLEVLRQMGIFVGIYAPASPERAYQMTDRLGLQGMAHFGMFANCSRSDEIDYLQMSEVILDNIPVMEHDIEEVQNHEILFIGRKHSTEMKDVRARGMQTLIWNPRRPNTEESAADIQHALHVIFERNSALHEMQPYMDL